MNQALQDVIEQAFTAQHRRPIRPYQYQTKAIMGLGKGVEWCGEGCQLPETRTNGTTCCSEKGEVPVKETVRVLAAHGYKGFYCFEWEKRWHPDIEEPEVSFPHYARTMQEYLGEFGIKA